MRLLVIDIQKGITDDRLYNFDNFIKNAIRIIDAAKRSKVRGDRDVLNKSSIKNY